MRAYLNLSLMIVVIVACAPPPAASSGAVAAAAPSRLCKPGATYCEDFAEVGEGALPTGWIGGDGLAVKVVGGRKVLAPFEPRDEYVVTMPEWRATRDFRIDILIRTSARNSTGMINERAHYSIRAGAMELALDTNWGKSTIRLNESREPLGDLDNAAVLVGLLREGNVCKVFVNSKQVLLARYDDVATIEGVSLVASHTGKDFAVHAVSLTTKDGAATTEAGSP